MIGKIVLLLAVITLVVVIVAAGLSLIITAICMRESLKEFWKAWKQEDESWKN